MPSDSDYVILSGLEWDTIYDISVVAENQKGKSEQARMSIRTSVQPAVMPGRLPSVLLARSPACSGANTATKHKCSEEHHSKLTFYFCPER